MFGERLRGLRKERKITLKELGERFQVAESTVSGWETGYRTPPAKVVKGLADFFEVSVSYLMGQMEYTEDEKTFLDDMDAPVEELKKKYDFGDFTDAEIDEAITYIKAKRIMNIIK